jgi:hypothetical protein
VIATENAAAVVRLNGENITTPKQTIAQQTKNYTTMQNTLKTIENDEEKINPISIELKTIKDKATYTFEDLDGLLAIP